MNFSLEKSLIYIIILAVLITLIFIFFLFSGQVIKSIRLQTPNGGEEWGIGQTHKISWQSTGIRRVGIVLFKGKEPKWIAQNVNANQREYQWKIYPGQEYGDDYWIAVFEYPWQKGNKIDFSDTAFAIVYPRLASCERLAVTKEWPYVPSDLPNLRRVFITRNNYTGNLGGLDEADRICQKEAKNQGFKGNWHAFLGGESPEDLAVERLKRTPRGTDGIFIQAEPEATLIRGANCHRLIAKNFDKFLEIFSSPLIINQKELEQNFYKELSNLWLGRINEESKKSCVEVSGISGSSSSSEKYSLTVTCQNWTTNKRMIEGVGSSLPNCYTATGQVTKALALAGLSSGISDNKFTPYQGKYCDNAQKLICIED